MRVRALAFVALLSAAVLAGCVESSDQGGEPLETPNASLVPLRERHLQPFNVTGFYSQTLRAGAYGILEAVSVDVRLDLPPQAGVDATLGTAASNMGLFLPDIPGCDWTATSLPDQCQVPIIVDAGPYYRSSTGASQLQGDNPAGLGEGDTVATEPAHRLGQFLIENFVPHGYAVAQLSVLGTGDSTFCQDLMGPNEQAGIDAAVTWLGTQAWSNGRVGLIGRSYDGSTPWEAAMFGNPHLATIVPISGLIGQHELMWRNGTAETRGPGVLYALYAAMTIDGEAADATQTLCPNYILGAPEGGLSYVTGSDNAAGPNTYWADRSFLDRALENYQGSVYLIHGLQDWNVDPHMAIPTYQRVVDAGLEAKGLLGQWNHMYPDRPSEHVSAPSGEGGEAFPASVRFDWAQDLLEWFDHYLKGTGPKPALHVEVQDNHGAWRVEPTYPPQDGTRVVYQLGSSMPKTSSGPSVVLPASGTLGLGGPQEAPVVFEAPPLAAETRIVGLANLHAFVTPAGSGGQLYAELQDVDPNGTALRLGHAIMDLRYAAGGTEPQPVVPGVRLQARMEFEPMDVVVPAGHSLRLVLTSTGRDYLPASTSAPVQVDASGASLLKLHVVERGPEAFFTPPAWSGDAEATAPQP